MKHPIWMTCFALVVLLTGILGAAEATTYIWNFSLPSGSQTSPHTYLDTSSTYPIPAYGYATANGPTSAIVNTDTWGPGGTFTNDTGLITSNNLYGKNDGPGEIGLGLAGFPSNEIQFRSFVQLDLTNLYANGFTKLTMTISSMQDQEGYYLWGSNTLGVPGLLLRKGIGPPPDETFDIPSFGVYKYFSVSATPIAPGFSASDVLILDGLTAQTPRPTTTVTQLNPLGPISLGQTVTDTVTINTTATGSLPAAGGTWKVEASQDPGFGSGVSLVQTGSVSGNLPFTVTTNAWAPPSAGVWYFRATYSGDANYGGSASTPTDEMLTVLRRLLTQASPATSADDGSFRGYLGRGPSAITAGPGILCIEPGGPNWPNYIPAARDGVPYTIKNITLVKTTPSVVQCSDMFPPLTVRQQGTRNIRLWWPLMYELPGTTFTLSILYGTPSLYDDDGSGPDKAGYVHLAQWTWTVDVDLDSLSTVLALFHELPFGRDEVPLVSDEVLYPILQGKIAAAKTAFANGDTATTASILADFELEVMDACIGTSPAFPNPTGSGTGIANTQENPACCKLLVDVGYILQNDGIGMPAK